VEGIDLVVDQILESTMSYHRPTERTCARNEWDWQRATDDDEEKEEEEGGGCRSEPSDTR
jgi:hypothetical protein